MFGRKNRKHDKGWTEAVGRVRAEDVPTVEFALSVALFDAIDAFDPDDLDDNAALTQTFGKAIYAALLGYQEFAPPLPDSAVPASVVEFHEAVATGIGNLTDEATETMMLVRLGPMILGEWDAADGLAAFHSGLLRWMMLSLMCSDKSEAPSPGEIALCFGGVQWFEEQMALTADEAAKAIATVGADNDEDEDDEDESGLRAGQEVVRQVFGSLGINLSWTTEARGGFAWWPYRLRHEITSRPCAQIPVADEVRYRVTMLEATEPFDSYLNTIDQLNRTTVLGAIVLDPATGTISYHSGVLVHPDNLWISKTFQMSVACIAATSEANVESFAQLLGSTPAYSTHPERGSRDEPDDILDVRDGLFDLAASMPLAEADEQAARSALKMVAPLGYHGTVSGKNIQAEARVRDTTQAGPDVRIAVETQWTDDLLGPGIRFICRPRLGAHDMDPAEIANALNLMEATDTIGAHHLGAWTTDDSGAVYYRGFQPWMCLTPNTDPAVAITNVLTEAYVHAKNALLSDRLLARAPGSEARQAEMGTNRFLDQIEGLSPPDAPTGLQGRTGPMTRDDASDGAAVDSAEARNSQSGAPSLDSSLDLEDLVDEVGDIGDVTMVAPVPDLLGLYEFDGLENVLLQLSAAIAAIPTDASLVVEWAGFDELTEGKRTARYVQFARNGSDLRAESVGNKYLRKPDRLTRSQVAVLRDIGWNKPGVGGNFQVDMGPPVPYNEIAMLAIVTMLDVHRHQNMGRLQIYGQPESIETLTPPSGHIVKLGLGQIELPARYAGAIWRSFWDTELNFTVVCPDCNWQGRAGDHMTEHDTVDSVSCPACGRVLVLRAPPTLVDTEQTARTQVLDIGDGRPGLGRAVLVEQRRADAKRVSQYDTMLHDPDQLPDLEGDTDIVISWDLDTSEPDEPAHVLRYGDRELWREIAVYDDYERFRIVFYMLRQRYGDRFAGLIPTRRSERWLYAGRRDVKVLITRMNNELVGIVDNTDAADEGFATEDWDSDDWDVDTYSDPDQMTGSEDEGSYVEDGGLDDEDEDDKNIAIILEFQPASTEVIGDAAILDQLSDKSAAKQVRQELISVIECHGPIRVDRLVRIVAQRFGLNTLRQARAEELEKLIPRKYVKRSKKFGDFAWPDGATLGNRPVVRVPREGEQRPIDEIAPEELLYAMSFVILNDDDIEYEDDLLRETARMFGVTRLGAKVRARLEAVYQLLMKEIDDAGT